MKLLIKKPDLLGGYALVTVLFFAAVGLLLLATTLTRSSGNASLTVRRNAYLDTMSASEADTEKVVSEMTADFLNTGASAVSSKIATYKSRIPTTTESTRWSNFSFKDKHGNLNATDLSLTADWTNAPLISQYQGLSGYAATYRITSLAQDLRGSHGNVSAGVQQDVQFAVVPVFQFTIFYNMDMEINPGADMTVKGRVHSNGNLYSQPQTTLTFQGDVTSAQSIIAGKSPNDPTTRTVGTLTFQGEHDGGVNSLNMPLGTNNSPAAIHAIVEKPPVGEDPNSVMGQQRLYNQADLIIEVHDGSVTITGGTANGGSNVSWASASAFISTNNTFYDYREQKTIKATQIDYHQLTNWFNGQTAIKQVNSIWVGDFRTQTSSTEPAVRVVNGQYLMTKGLTVATPDPLYVWGDFNVDGSQKNSSNTSKSQPAAFVADSINVLSGSWNDSYNSGTALSGRNVSANMTVNAAFLAGIVPSGNGYYSGGVENFPRFNESWSSRTFTYNGSMVVMYPSQVATTSWKGTGSVLNTYNPPTRAWNFDANFSDPNKLPPMTPSVRTAVRGTWAVVAGN